MHSQYWNKNVKMNQCLDLLKNVLNKRMKSEAKEKSGYLKVAGLFFSKKKCPTHANP